MVDLKEAALIACKCGYDRTINDIGRIFELNDSFFFMFGAPHGGMVYVNKDDGSTVYTFLPPFKSEVEYVNIPCSTLRAMFE